MKFSIFAVATLLFASLQITRKTRERSCARFRPDLRKLATARGSSTRTSTVIQSCCVKAANAMGRRFQSSQAEADQRGAEHYLHAGGRHIAQ